MTNKFPAMSLAEAHALLTRRGSPFEMEERDIRGVRTPRLPSPKRCSARG